MDEEIRHLEAVLSGTEQTGLRPPAVFGRLAQLYLGEGPDQRPDRALELAERGLALVAEGDPLYPKLLHATAAALRAGLAPPPGALGPDGRAARLDRDSWLLSVDPAPGDAVLAATEWGDWAWQRDLWDEAAEAYEGARIALHRIVLRSAPGVINRLKLLGQHAYIGPRSAFAYAQVGRSQEAVTVLERIGDLLTAFGSQREDLDRLPVLGRADLQGLLLAAQHELTEQGDSLDAYGHLQAGRQQAQARVNALIKEIRALPGMARFATPAAWADVHAAAQSQPVVYLAATDKGTVVLAVEQGADRIMRSCLEHSQQDIGAAMRDFFAAEYEGSQTNPREALLRALEWLSRIMRPVLNAVGSDQPIVLVPFGMLAQLPLHAAYETPQAAGAGPVQAYFLFHPSHISYAGSARSWLRCQARGAQCRGSGALVVNNPAPLPATLDDLQLSDFERDAVARHFGVTELAGRDATGERILQTLPAADVAHLSCHGTIDNRFLYTGVLVVAELQVLTVRSWEDVSGLNARLIFLSACATGMSALGMPQLASVPSALLASGAAAVIASFWHTDEMATLLLVTKFYDLWQGGRGAGLAEALGGAKAWVAMSPAATLRAALPEAALATSAGKRLAACPDQDLPFTHPWFWSPFFLLGA